MAYGYRAGIRGELSNSAGRGRSGPDVNGQLLLVRPRDLLILGVQWSRMRAIGDPPVLEAEDDAAEVVLTFPPQHVAEQVGLPEGAPPQAVLAGASTVVFSLTAGARLPLDAEGLLRALRTTPVVAATSVELPWGLLARPGPRSGEEPVTADHHAAPVVSSAGAVGLWRTRFTAPSGLVLIPSDNRQADPGFEIPLTQASRQKVLELGRAAPPPADRFDASSLGGSLTVRAVWPSFEWDHDAALGRDRLVRVLAKGALYPFGHRAELSEVTERTFESGPGGSVAVLRKRGVLTVTETVHAIGGGDAERRAFPFREVEITRRTYSLSSPGSAEGDLAAPAWAQGPRPTPELATLHEGLGAAIARFEEIRGPVEAEMTRDRSREELDAIGHPAAVSLADAEAALGAAQAALDAAGAGSGPDEHSAILAQIDAVERMLAGMVLTDPPDPAEVALRQELSNLFAQLAALPPPVSTAPLEQAVAEAHAGVQAAQMALDGELVRDRPLEELVADGFQRAQEYADLTAEITRLRERIAQQEPFAAPVNLFFVPRGNDGLPFRFPLRCAAANGDVFFDLPLIFVDGVELPAADGIPAFTPSTDPQVAAAVRSEWEGAALGNVVLPGTPVALVPDDVHEVHALRIGGPREGATQPRLERAAVALPALRELLGKVEHVPVAFTDGFITHGDAEDVALRVLVEELGPSGLAVDFTAQADRSGGLVAPRYLVDGISRTLGPIKQVPGLGRGPIDPATLFEEGATLLGFDLREIVGALDAPPLIQQVLEAGRPPAVRMEWKDVPLQDVPPFKSKGSTLTLTVETSVGGSTTTCTVGAFELVLPDPDAPLVVLSFDSLTFVQVPGRPPDLRVTGLNVTFSDELELLKGLVDALPLGDAGPLVRAAPEGVTATYTVPLPPVPAGAFVLRNVVASIAVDVPFSRRSPSITLAFASRAKPFALSVLVFGGGGYIELEIGGGGLNRLEASLEFGALTAVDFVVARGEVHALGGVQLAVEPAGGFGFSGYLRIGGSLEVLGLVSVSVELVVALRYESEPEPRLFGQATLVIEVDLTLFSDTVELDSGEWELVGGGARDDAPVPAIGAGEDDSWAEYRRAFEPA